MVEFTAISLERHKSLRWKFAKNLSFAGTETTVTIVGSELALVVPAMPLAFVSQRGRLTLVGLLSLTPGKNLFVGPAGNWLGSYIPAAIRSYPFRLMQPDGAKEPLLCLDEAQGLVTDGRGEAFFTDGGTVSPALQSVLEFQIEYERTRALTDSAVSALAHAGVLAPWKITLKTEQGERSVEGLNRIDETALAQLSDEAFCKLRLAGALQVAYGQLFSMKQLSIFQALTEIQAKLAPKPLQPMPSTLDHLFDRNDDIELKFD